MKCKITRKERDRQGGHKSQMNSSVGSIEITPKMKKFIKQQSVKKIRRDHAKALRSAYQEYELDVQDRWNDPFDDLIRDPGYIEWLAYLNPCQDDYYADYEYEDPFYNDDWDEPYIPFY